MRMDRDTEMRNRRGWEGKRDRTGPSCQSRAKTGAGGEMTPLNDGQRGRPKTDRRSEVSSQTTERRPTTTPLAVRRARTLGFVLAVNPAGFPPAAKLSVVTQTIPDVVGNRGAPQRLNMGPPASPGCTRAALSDEMGPGWCL